MSELENGGVAVLVALFSKEETADEALKAMQKAKVHEEIYFEDASVIKKDPDGSIHVRETEDTTTGKGAGIGAVIGGVIGLIGGPAGVVVAAGTGAVIGGLMAKGDAGFRDESLEEVGENLAPGTSALVAITSQGFLEPTLDYLKGYDAVVTTHALGDDIAAQWRMGEDVTPMADMPDEGEAES
jgi:uncharacterized membrane protein